MRYEITGVLYGGDQSDYIVIENSDNKMWIVPCKNMKTALALYQPTSFKGKILKNFIPYIYKINFACKKLHIERKRLMVSRAFENKLEKLFSNSNLNFSFFLGTPSVHQKTTIQIFDNENILGYCKISDNPEIINLFYRERDLLNYLYSKGINNIPLAMFNGPINEYIEIFVQSTTKSNKSKVIHTITEKHIKFLKDLEEKTKIRCQYENSDYKESIEKIKYNIKFLNNAQHRDTILRMVDIIEEKILKIEYFSFYHGDFTPWNMFYENSELFVFDFEYAQKKYPPMIDIFHFFTQVAIFKNKKGAIGIYEEFQELFIEGVYKDLFDNPTLYYIFYLVDIISLYLARDQENLSRDVEQNMRIWIELLQRLEPEYSN